MTDDINPIDLRVVVTRSGLRVHVLIEHIPTGIVGTSDIFKSELRNKAEALQQIRQQLAERSHG